MTPLLSGIALAVVVVLASIGALHVYWALGGRWGSHAVIPEVNGRPAFRPGPIATLLVALLLAAAATILSLRARLVSSEHADALLVRLGAWGVCATFVLRTVGDFRNFGLFKRSRDTVFARWDSRLFTPLCFALAVGCFLVARAP